MAMVTDDLQAFLRLQAWLSPAFPVGGFAYSGGLEASVHDRRISSAKELRAWLVTLLAHGSFWNDAVLAAAAWRASEKPAQLIEIAALAEALAGSAERHAEIIQQGEAFLAAARAWPHPVLETLDGRAPYAVAIGAVASAHRVPLAATIAAMLHALASQQVSAAIRLGVCGQTSGVAVLAELEPTIASTANRAADSSLDDLGGCALVADIMSLRHEELHSRLFRS
jgi:urease accessory protein